MSATPALAQRAAFIDPVRVFNESAAGKEAQIVLGAQTNAAYAELEKEAAGIKTEKAGYDAKFDGKTDDEVKAILDADPNLKTRYNLFIVNSDLFIQKRIAYSQGLKANADKVAGIVLDAAGPDVEAAKVAIGATSLVTTRPIPAGATDITADVIKRFSARVKRVPLPPPAPLPTKPS